MSLCCLRCMMAVVVYDYAGEMPTDGGDYTKKTDNWYCELCWKNVDDGHLVGDKHLRRLAWHLQRRAQQPAPGQDQPSQQLSVEVPGPRQQMPVAAAAAAASQPPGHGQLQPPQQQLPVIAEMPRPHQQLPVAAAWQPTVEIPGPPPGQPLGGAEAEAPPPGPPTVSNRMAGMEARLTHVEELLMEIAARLREKNE